MDALPLSRDGQKGPSGSGRGGGGRGSSSRGRHRSSLASALRPQDARGPPGGSRPRGPRLPYSQQRGVCGSGPGRAPDSGPYLLPRRPSPRRGPSPARRARSRRARPALQQAGRHEPVESPPPSSCALSPRARRRPAAPAAPTAPAHGLTRRPVQSWPARAPLLRLQSERPARAHWLGRVLSSPFRRPRLPPSFLLCPPSPGEPRPSPAAEGGPPRAEPSWAWAAAGRGRGPGTPRCAGGAEEPRRGGRVARALPAARVSAGRRGGPPGLDQGPPGCLRTRFRAACLCPTPRARPWCGRRPQPGGQPSVPPRGRLPQSPRPAAMGGGERAQP